jgi:hypothetical protein
MPKSASSSLHLEYHIVSDLFQIIYDFRLPCRACVFQGFHQPGQSRSVSIHFRLQRLHLHSPSLVTAAHPVYCRTTVCMGVWATYFGPISPDASPRAFTAAPMSDMTSVVTGAHILLSLSPLPRYGHRLLLPKPYLCRTPHTTSLSTGFTTLNTSPYLRPRSRWEPACSTVPDPYEVLC